MLLIFSVVNENMNREYLVLSLPWGQNIIFSIVILFDYAVKKNT